MTGIVIGVVVVVFGLVFAVITSGRRHRQHEADIQQLVELRGRLDDNAAAELAATTSESGDQPAGQDQSTNPRDKEV